MGWYNPSIVHVINKGGWPMTAPRSVAYFRSVVWYGFAGQRSFESRF